MFEIFMILGGIAARLLPHAPNFTPIAAIALFGGVYLNRKYAIVLPLIAMLISDLFIGFHETMFAVYGAFLLTGCLGLWLRKHKNVKYIVGASLASSIMFFLITNFGFWLTYSLYPKTMAGQLEAYAMALPFFRNTLMGDLFYTGVFFGSYEFIKMLVVKRAFAITKAQK